MLAYILLCVGVILLFGISLINFSVGANDIAFGYAIAGALLLLVPLIYLYLLKPYNEKVSRDKLLIWLLENEEMVLSYGARYKYENITAETLIVRYSIIYSLISLCRRTYTNYYIKGTGAAINVKYISTLFNFIFGWWSLPWGFFYTPLSLSINLQDKEAISVGKFLTNKEKYMNKDLATNSWFRKSYSNID